MNLMEYLLSLSKFNTAYARVTCCRSGHLILPCFKPTIWPHQCVSLSCLYFKIPLHLLSGSPISWGTVTYEYSTSHGVTLLHFAWEASPLLLQKLEGVLATDAVLSHCSPPPFFFPSFCLYPSVVLCILI